MFMGLKDSNASTAPNGDAVPSQLNETRFFSRTTQMQSLPLPVIGYPYPIIDQRQQPLFHECTTVCAQIVYATMRTFWQLQYILQSWCGCDQNFG